MFSDDDIKLHLRHVGLSKGATVTRYAAIGIPDEKCPGQGKEPHMARLRRENQAVFTLADSNGCGWRRLSELKENR